MNYSLNFTTTVDTYLIVHVSLPLCLNHHSTSVIYTRCYSGRSCETGVQNTAVLSIPRGSPEVFEIEEVQIISGEYCNQRESISTHWYISRAADRRSLAGETENLRAWEFIRATQFPLYCTDTYGRVAVEAYKRCEIYRSKSQRT